MTNKHFISNITKFFQNPKIYYSLFWIFSILAIIIGVFTRLVAVFQYASFMGDQSRDGFVHF
jgi:hypothetical protein